MVIRMESRFVQYGKTCQLRIESGSDLEAVLQLDKSLWVATSAPVQAFRCDPRLMQILDADGKGRIQTGDVCRAVRWLLDSLHDTSRLGEARDRLRLAAIQSGTEEGVRMINAAHYILNVLQAENQESIDLGQVRDFLDDLLARPLNGDGVVVPEAATDPAVQTYIRDVNACVGGTVDASGKPGVTAAQLDAFTSAAASYLAWRRKGEGLESVNPLARLGEGTARAYAVFREHADAVDLFFRLCAAMRFEPRIGTRLDEQAGALGSYNLLDEADLERVCSASPIARPTTGGVLPLEGDSVNPHFRRWVAELNRAVLTPLFGQRKEELVENEWREVCDALAPYSAYLTGKAGACVEQIQPDVLTGYVEGTFAQQVRVLIEADRQVAEVRDGALLLEKLLLFHAHLLPLLNNFVNFSRLYDADRRAMFETGSAVIDGRWFNLAVRVDDVAAHSALARSSNLFMLYLEVGAKDSIDSFTVAVPATAGSKGNLCVGKRGAFFDTEGREYGARIVQMIENPISVREALAAPFVRLWQFVVGKIEAMSGSSEKDLQAKADALFKQATPGAAPAGQAASVAGGPAGSLLVGLSLSAAAVGSAFAFITKTFTGMSRYQLVAGLLGAAVVVMVPVTLIAMLKLSRQDLSALLEGCGWAINARMRLTRAQRRQFTIRPSFPEGAVGVPRYGWVPAAVTVVVLVAVAGFLYLLITG
jgi:hypothetical protein